MGMLLVSLMPCVCVDILNVPAFICVCVLSPTVLYQTAGLAPLSLGRSTQTGRLKSD